MDLSSTVMDAFVRYVLPSLATAIGGLLVAALGVLTMWLREKGKESKAARVGATFADLAHSVVAHVEVELRPEVAKAFSDGRLSAEEGKALKAKAMELVMQKAPPELKRAAGQLFGPLLETWVSGLIERAHAVMPDMPGGAPIGARPTPPGGVGVLTPPERPSAISTVRPTTPPIESR